MSQNNLKLMIDYTFGGPVAKKLNTLGAVTAKTITEHGLPQNAEDSKIIEKTTEDNYILLTHDHSTINERTYEPCTHAGVLIVMDKHWDEEKIYNRVKNFCQSGERGKASHCVTKLYEEEARIFMHENKEKVVLFAKNKSNKTNDDKTQQKTRKRER